MAKAKIAREAIETSAEFSRKAYDEILDFFGYGAGADEIMSGAGNLSPQTRNILKALERDDFLGFETPDQTLKQFIQDPVYTYENYDISPQLKGALTKNAYSPKPKKTMDDVAPRIGGSEKLSSGMDYDLSNAQKTQVSNTGGTYQKARGLLDSLGVGDDVLDYGAGKGHGTPILRGKSYEPFPNKWEPDFTGLTPPDQEFEGVVNLNVLNVLPPEVRQEVAQGVLNAIKKDGYGVVGARSYPDVMSAKVKTPTGDGGIITGRDTYQYGFGGENEGLVDFLIRMAKTMPEKEFDITPAKGIAATGAKIKRLKSGALPTAGAGLLDAVQQNEAQVELDSLMGQYNEFMDRKPDIYNYGDLAPVKRNVVSGEYSVAVPIVVDDIMKGLLDLGQSRKTGVVNSGTSLLDALL